MILINCAFLCTSTLRKLGRYNCKTQGNCALVEHEEIHGCRFVHFKHRLQKITEILTELIQFESNFLILFTLFRFYNARYCRNFFSIFFSIFNSHNVLIYLSYESTNFIKKANDYFSEATFQRRGDIRERTSVLMEYIRQ